MKVEEPGAIELEPWIRIAAEGDEPFIFEQLDGRADHAPPVDEDPLFELLFGVELPEGFILRTCLAMLLCNIIGFSGLEAVLQFDVVPVLEE